MQAPDGTFPTTGTKVGFEAEIAGRNGNDAGAHGRAAWLAEVSGGQEAVVPVVSIEEQDVDVAMELAVLEGVVEDVDAGLASFGERVGFGQEPAS